MKKSPTLKTLPLSNCHILIVDDEPDNLDVLAQALGVHGAQVSSHTSAAQAFQSVINKLPDLILTDIQMPDVDGFGFLEMLRAEANCATVPVIAITAHVMRGDREQILGSGFSGYIDKPFAIGKLLKQIAPFVSNDKIKTLLLVSHRYYIDDDVQHSLEQRQHFLHHFTDYESASQAAQHFHLDLALLDAELPFNNEVYQLIATKSPSCPIVAILQDESDANHIPFPSQSALSSESNPHDFLAHIAFYLPKLGELVNAS